MGVAGVAAAVPVAAQRPDARSTDARGSQEALPRLNRPAGSPEQIARDEAYWRRVAAYYKVGEDYTNLEAGYWGMMAAPVLAAYHEHIDRVNQHNSYYARREYSRDSSSARERVAEFIGAKPSEIAFTRGATEALQRLIIQYRPLKAGEAVIYADLDYGAMQLAMDALAEQRGARVVRFDFPEPATYQSMLDVYRKVLDDTPDARLLLLTHLNNKTGLIIPVKEITEMARARGVDVVVDAAHSFGQCDITLDDLGADFVGLNLHKWLGAPVGAGLMYIKEDRITDVAPMLGEPESDGITSRIHTGTMNFATFLTVPNALDFHDEVGSPFKAARLRYLRDRWVAEVRETPGIDILTPDDVDSVAAITSFRLKGQTGTSENQAIVAQLLEQYGVFTVWRAGVAPGDCVRVTPALYNTPDDVDHLASSLRAMAAE